MRRLTLALLAVGLSVGSGLAAAQEAAPPKTPPPPAKSSSPPVVTPTPSTAAPAPLPPNAILAQAPIASSGDTTPPPPKPAAPSKPAQAPEAPKPPPEPLKRPRFISAIMQGVDKITAETLRFEAKVGEPVRYKGLILTVRACEATASDEDITDNAAYVDVQSQPELLPGRAAAPPRQVFKGWMFASSPTLHPLEHPVYDLWLIACRTAAPGAQDASR